MKLLVLMLSSADNTVMHSGSQRRTLLAICFMIAAIISLFVIVPQLRNFNGSIAALQQAKLGYVGVAFAAVGVSILSAAGVYQLLSFRRIRFGDSLLVQIAGLFVNRIVPAGFGGLGLNYLYMKRAGHTNTQATTIVALNNLLGGLGHALLLGLMVILLRHDSYNIAPSQFRVAPWMGLAVAIGALAVVGLLYAQRVKLHRARANVFKQLRQLGRYYAQSPLRLGGAQLVSVALTLSNVLALYVCCLAVGISLPFPIIFLIFTLGVAVGTAVPTPGGLGGTEAGLVAGLVAQHTMSPTALAAVLLYRLISFWPGLVVGAGSLYIVQKKHLLTK